MCEAVCGVVEEYNDYNDAIVILRILSTHERGKNLIKSQQFIKEKLTEHVQQETHENQTINCVCVCVCVECF